MRRAILSVSDKSGLVEFARGLASRGFELVSTGGTARALADAGLPVINVSDVTGFPEMMDGRVKTLHPKIHGGILARRAHADGSRRGARRTASAWSTSSASTCIRSSQTAAKPGVAFDDLIEQIDIGGPSLVRAAAKNFRDVLVVVSPADYHAVSSPRSIARVGRRLAFRFDLARRAFAHTGAYDTAIASTLGEVRVEDEAFTRETGGLQRLLPAQLDHRRRSKLRDLRYGENPHQPAAWYAVDPPAGLGAAVDSAGQGAVVHQSARSRRRRAHRARVRRAGGLRDQAHQSLRRGDRRRPSPRPTRARATPMRSPPSAASSVSIGRSTSDTARAIVVDVHRSRHRASGGRRRPSTILADQSQHARRDDRLRGARRAQRVHTRELRSILGALLVQQRDEVVEARGAWPADSAEGRHQACSRPRRNGRRCGLRGA